MQDFATDPKRRPDGSIDTAHYISRGLDARARALRERPSAPGGLGSLVGLRAFILAAIRSRSAPR